MKVWGAFFMRKFILALAFSTSSLYPATKYKETTEPKDYRYHLSGESVIAFTERGSEVAPGFGLGFQKTVDERGWVYDVGLYFVKGMNGIPLYYHPGFQFDSHFRLSGIVGGGLLTVDRFTAIILITALEFEMSPVHNQSLEISLFPGVGSVYIVFAPTPYVGARIVANIAGPVDVHATVRTFFIKDFFVLSSLGIRVAL